MKISTRLFVVLALLLSSFSAYAATVVVRVGVVVQGNPNNYGPQNITIRPGDFVRWEWESGAHPTVADDGVSFPAFSVTAGNPVTYGPFNTLGTITYHCQPHAFQVNGVWQGMIGSITVSNAPLATLDSKAAAIGLNIYPNPSKGLVMLTVNQKASAETVYKLRLSNIIGREVRTFTLRPEAATTGMPLNLSDLPAGMYVYSLMLNDKVVATRRLVLQN
ncbi:MAG TPA: T9SS type A sorting domain-containing protein [Hymenobacter sp.]|nr:T9SS type A sorting domain-containing protein [Hymenobacter sp.]